MMLSVVIPVYNEKATIVALIERVRAFRSTRRSSSSTIARPTRRGDAAALAAARTCVIGCFHE